MSLPLVSLVTPSFNQGQYIEATINSVLSQHYESLEYIIIDGGSTDSSVDVIKKHAEKLAFWCSEKDTGQSNAINKGFRRSTGKYVGWLNSDDVLLPGSLRKMVGYLESDSAYDVVYGNTTFIGRSGSTFGKRLEIPFDRAIMIYGYNYIPQPSTLFRRSLLDELGFLDESLHYTMDHEFWLRVYDAGRKFCYANDFFSGYRFHLQSKGLGPAGSIERERDLLKKRFGGLSIKDRRLQKLLFFLIGAYQRIRKKWLVFVYHGTPDLVPLTITLFWQKLKERL